MWAAFPRVLSPFCLFSSLVMKPGAREFSRGCGCSGRLIFDGLKRRAALEFVATKMHGKISTASELHHKKDNLQDCQHSNREDIVTAHEVS